MKILIDGAAFARTKGPEALNWAASLLSAFEAADFEGEVYFLRRRNSWVPPETKRLHILEGPNPDISRWPMECLGLSALCARLEVDVFIGTGHSIVFGPAKSIVLIPPQYGRRSINSYSLHPSLLLVALYAAHTIMVFDKPSRDFIINEVGRNVPADLLMDVQALKFGDLAMLSESGVVNAVARIVDMGRGIGAKEVTQLKRDFLKQYVEMKAEGLRRAELTRGLQMEALLSRGDFWGRLYRLQRILRRKLSTIFE